MSNKHKVYVAFHSDDIDYKDVFEEMFGDCIISKSVQEGDIPDGLCNDEIMRRIRTGYLADSTVTVVLIGKETYKRKFVDWEIYSSLRDTESSPRSGLLGLLLPTHPSYYTEHYDPQLIPPRLQAQVQTGFAKIYNWQTDKELISKCIDDAFSRRKTYSVDLTEPRMARNRP